MKILKMYLEDEVICMEVEGFSEKILLENHVDNRRLMREFEYSKMSSETPRKKFKINGIKKGFMILMLMSISTIGFSQLPKEEVEWYEEYKKEVVHPEPQPAVTNTAVYIKLIDGIENTPVGGEFAVYIDEQEFLFIHLSYRWELQIDGIDWAESDLDGCIRAYYEYVFNQ